MKTWKDRQNLLHKGPLLAVKNGFEIIDCETCGFAHIIPIPTEEELENTYSHEYYDSDKPLYIDRYIEDKDWHDVTNSRRYDIFEQHITSKNKKILDIGSGPGLFLKHGEARGWDVQGIEPSRQAYNYSAKQLGLNIFNGFFSPETFKNFGKFDVVNLSLVLEHIPNPEEFIKLIQFITKRSGLISISVPNDFSVFQNILNKNLDFDQWWVAPPHHINYFNHRSLAKLIEKMNYEIVYQEGSFPIDMFLLMGDNYINNDELGRNFHNKRKEFDINISKSDISKELYSSFSKLDIGREATIIAKNNY